MKTWQEHEAEMNKEDIGEWKRIAIGVVLVIGLLALTVGLFGR
ncbi:hypothetical protein [Alteromonas macleodii]|uniref:Uncharacterized protein n=1 Tax=Alteromonas macleodii TaxID=28108 RepID=A0AB36FR51_ALTMA|nr:hypothetical protein [Alteromonas macleodii]OES24462.1 hypothetical protein BFV95_4729 [Alteromonas macleodii]OES25519.1 hypothetical protein BFV94_4372 [Alteromonas macleodii]OES25822.1 hypothetical protein BFV93_4285 [Alteromonas macleodii]OES38659.1 hypothetical protein BFV96_4770 [Alteromonas macleodii]